MKLAERFGRRRPFKVPEGYFDDFAAQMMAKLPARPDVEADANSPQHLVALQGAVGQEQPSGARVARKRPLWTRRITVAAASVCVALFGASVFMHEFAPRQVQQASPMQAEAVTLTTDADLDAMADYAMLDADDFYAYMAETY